MPIPIMEIKGVDKCPKCGSDKRATGEYIKALKDGLYLPLDFDEDCLKLQIPFLSALNSPLNLEQKIPILLIHFAVCGEEDCFTMYVTKITSIASDPITQQQQPPGGKMPK